MAVIFLQQTDSDILDVMDLVLCLEGFNVHAIKGYPEGLAGHIISLAPDLVLLDYHRDGKACLYIFRELREKGAGMPVIISGCSAKVPAFCERHGFDACLEMPFDLSIFYETLTGTLRASGKASGSLGVGS